jgi:class 3 adenylate cyclase/tetratricopeptide (TPR) repeat protein
MLTCPSCGQENPNGFKLCGMCGTSLVAEPAGTREERKVVTVLFADLVGFTARAEHLDPEDVRALLAPYHARLREELERHGGTVEKFIGDAVMALFGAPLVHEDDPERAVRAAMAIRDWIQDEEELQVRIAVNTGEALIRMGSAVSEGEGMASGDVVNTAARLQSAAPVNGILVGETTHRATSHAIQYRDAEPVEAKGKAKPVLVWEAVQPRARFGVDLLREVKTGLIGRERELDALKDTLARARGQPSVQLLTLVGEPGIGKSRLVFELMQVVESQPDLIRWRQGRSLPYGEGGSFWALAEMVKAEAAILETDSPEQVTEKVHAAVRAVMLDEGEAGWVEGHLRTLVGVGEEAELVPERRKEAFAAWRRFLEALAHERPLVLVFDDLHSADDSMLDFVDHLVDWASGVPILVLATARPELFERRPGWGGGKPNVTTLAVAPLTDQETQRLIAALLERPLLPAKTQSDLLSRAGGNPLYAEQFVRMLAEHGSAETLPLPETVQGIIAARLDLLSGDEKRLIQDASVVGKVFWGGAAAAIAQAEPMLTEEQLHALERKEFVQRAQHSSVAGETEYAFRHLLVRDVAYGQIPRAARAAKHRAAAAWIESLPRPDDHAETLAHHYSRALELARAVGQDTDELVGRARAALRSAGDRAHVLGSAVAALEFYREAVALWPEGSIDWARLVARLRRTARVVSETHEHEDLVRARDTLLAEGDLETAAEAELYLSWDAWNEGRGEETASHLGRVLELAGPLPPSHTKAYLLGNVAIQLMLTSQLERSLATANASLEIAEQLDLDDVRAHALNTIGLARALGRDPGGLEQLERSLAMSLEQNHAENVVRGYKNLGSVLFELGELERLPELYAGASAVAERFGDAFNLRWFSVERAVFDFLDGRWDDALRTLDEFVDWIETGFTHYMEAAARTMRAQIRLARGDIEAALADASKSVDFGRSSGEPQVLLFALAVYTSALFGAGKVTDARKAADELLAATTEGMTSWLCEVAPVLSMLGRGPEFLARFEHLERPSVWETAAFAVLAGDLWRAIDAYVEIGARPYEAEARLLAAQQAADDGPVAREHAQRALDFYRSVGADFRVREAEQILGISAARADTGSRSASS